MEQKKATLAVTCWASGVAGSSGPFYDVDQGDLKDKIKAQLGDVYVLSWSKGQTIAHPFTSTTGAYGHRNPGVLEVTIVYLEKKKKV